MGERSVGVDLVRVVAVVAIVLSHVWGSTDLRTVVHPWHVPVFFLLTGYLWRPGRTLRDEVRRRTSTLLVPYVAWLAVLLAVVVAAALLAGDGLPLGSVRDALLGGAHAGRPFSAFWFVTALVVAVVLHRLLERLPPAWRWALVLLGLALGYAAGDLLVRLPLSLGLAVPCLVLVAAGAELARVRPRIRGRRAVAVGAAAVVVGGLAVATGVSAPVDLKQVDLGTPVVSVVVAVLLSVGLVLLAESLATRLPDRVGRAVVALAATGLLVVLTHALVLWLLDTPEEGRVLDAVLAITVPWAVGLLVLRQPWTAWILAGRPASTATGSQSPRPHEVNSGDRTEMA